MSSGAAAATAANEPADGDDDPGDGDDDPGDGRKRKRLLSGVLLHPDQKSVRRSRTTPKKQPTAPESSNAAGKQPAALVAHGVGVDDGVAVQNALVGDGPLPRYAAAAVPVDTGAAAIKKVEEDEAARFQWDEETARAQAKYDQEWLAERRPTDEYLAQGAQLVADPEVPIFRIVGELSACQMMTGRLGAYRPEEPAEAAVLKVSDAELARTDAAWLRLCDADWMDPIIEQEVDAAPADRKAGVREELRETQLDLQFAESRPCGVPHLRQFAQAMFPCKNDLDKCHGWDAHLVCGEPHSKVTVTGRLLSSAVDLLIREGLDTEGYRQMVCPVDLHRNFLTDEGPVTWRSLHPCMHWLCDVCANEWVHVREKRKCPFGCDKEIVFTCKATRS